METHGSKSRTRSSHTNMNVLLKNYKWILILVLSTSEMGNLVSGSTYPLLFMLSQIGVSERLEVQRIKSETN